MCNFVFLVTAALTGLIVTLMEVELYYISKKTKLLVTTFEEGIKVIFVEIDFRERERKWLSGCSCNPHKSKIENQLNI